jgi:RNA polymerase sigma-70 factor (ECF subfamily)
MIFIKVATCLASSSRSQLMFCKQNDTYQVDEICFEYLNGLYSYALVLSRNHADAEDLVQQTYVRAMRATGKLRADRNTKCRFFTILRNIWVIQLRRRRSLPQSFATGLDDVFANEMAGPSKSSCDLYVSNRERKQVQAAIQELPVDFGEAIVLRECEELSFQEIASIVGCPAETVKSRLARARSMLRIVLSAKLEKHGLSQEEKHETRVGLQ